LTRLQKHQLEGLPSNLGWVFPKYADQSVLNLPGTVCQLLGAPAFGAPPLQQDLLAKVGGPYQRVVLTLVDALALQRLQAWMQEPEFAIWKQLSETGMLAPITSLSPSTTAAVLTSFWTGRAPANHSVVGYELWLREFGVVANMITHSPISFGLQTTGMLQHAGFVPETFLGLPTLGAHLAANGVKPYAFQHRSIQGSGLSNMFFPQVTRVGYSGYEDCWSLLRELMQMRTNERAFYWVYWGYLDTLSHKHGPGDERVRAEFAAFTRAFEHEFFSKLSAAGRSNTLFVLVADHGHMYTEKDPHYDLRNHPNLTRRLHMQPTGEHRLAYLYVKPGQTEAVREYIERTWPNQFAIFESAYVQEHGLFGGPASPQLAERIGDLTVIARGSAYWWWGAGENPIFGRHGGLTAEEMIVPFLAAPLSS
jgi:predicted AlkP superfamily pyrophosphatase or phosphodiesterase